MKATANEVFGPGTEAVIGDAPERIECDVIIVGAGMAGATAAWALRDSGNRVLVVEQGDFLPSEWQNWSAREVHQLGRYKNSAPWLDQDGQEFVPGNYHYVGGNTKFFGATLTRLREDDFGPVETHDGLSPAWPIAYGDLEPHYEVIERQFCAHAPVGDPTEPPHANAPTHPAMRHDPVIERLAGRLRRQGLQPFTLAQAVDDSPDGRCVLCSTCDGYPCLVDAKGDADVAAMRPALRSPTVRLLTRAEVTRVDVDADGDRITGVQLVRDGRRHTVVAARTVLAAGAVNTAAMLLRSRCDAHPAGLANGSDQVGRNYMAHTCSFVIGVRPGREQHIVFEKTLGLNDWYRAGPTTPVPLGNVAALGKLVAASVKPARPWAPMAVLDWMMNRSVDFFVQTEDLPLPENRVLVEPHGQIRLCRRPTNLEPHRELVRRLRRALRRAGYPFTFVQELGLELTAHQCGTVRMGTDPETSVVDAECRAHELENLWVIDSSVFPSSAAVNPALTVAANALRVASGAALAR